MSIPACTDTVESPTTATTVDERPTTTDAEETVSPSETADLLKVLTTDESLKAFSEVVFGHGFDLDLSACCAEQITVLAPSDSAFDAFLASRGVTLQEFLDQDPEGTWRLFGGHILLDAPGAAPGEYEVPSLLAGPLKLAVDESGAITLVDHPDVSLTRTIDASNGSVHVIDSVLELSGSPSASDPGAPAVADGIAADTFVEGEVSLEQLQPELSFTTPDRWFVAVAQPGAVILEDLDRTTDFTRAVLFLNARPFEASSVDEWSEGHEDVSVLAREETIVDGREGVVYDITFDGEGELPFLSAQCCGGRIILRNGEYYRVWVLDSGGEAPLVIFSPVLRDDVDWYDKVDGIIDTLDIAS